MLLFNGESKGKRFSISITPSCERTTRDSDGTAHKSSNSLAVGVITHNDGKTVSDIIEREYSHACEYQFIRKDMRNLLLNNWGVTNDYF